MPPFSVYAGPQPDDVYPSTTPLPDGTTASVDSVSFTVTLVDAPGNEIHVLAAPMAVRVSYVDGLDMRAVKLYLWDAGMSAWVDSAVYCTLPACATQVLGMRDWCVPPRSHTRT
jgi:hypothetical protein